MAVPHSALASEIDLNRPAPRPGRMAPKPAGDLHCDARSPQDILAAWTLDIETACHCLRAPSGKPSQDPGGGDDDFPDLLFA